MTLKREIKDTYIENGHPVYIKTHSDAVYVDENETETLTERLDNVKDSIIEHTTQLNENTQDLATVKTDYAKKTDVNNLANNKAEKSDLLSTNTELSAQKSRIDALIKLNDGSTTASGNTVLLTPIL